MRSTIFYVLRKIRFFQKDLCFWSGYVILSITKIKIGVAYDR